MDDFTFPATAAPAESSSSPADTLCLHHHRHHSLLPFPHFANSPLWFPVDAAVAVAPPPLMTSRTEDDMEEEEEQEPAWADAEGGEGERGAGGEALDDIKRGFVRGGVEGDQEKMDMLWENFNEELEALRRCSKQKAAACEVESDTESEERGRGCAPMPMLQASSRAGGTGQYYRRASSWVLLMRIFRRLFVVEKTFSSSASSSASARHRQPNAAGR